MRHTGVVLENQQVLHAEIGALASVKRNPSGSAFMSGSSILPHDDRRFAILRLRALPGKRRISAVTHLIHRVADTTRPLAQRMPPVERKA
jgi:hypothetical protein